MNRFRSLPSPQAGLHKHRERWSLTRSDAAIEEEVWEMIFRDRSLGPKYREHLLVDVEHGRVRLRGHVLQPYHSPLLAFIASRVEGVVSVEEELVADQHLQDQVIKALLLDEMTTPYIFTVKSRFGWISLGGMLPSREIAHTAECVVGWVPNVRGVLSLPTVIDSVWTEAEQAEVVRRAIQPRLGAVVYQDGDESDALPVGLVAQVLLDPCSRLVSAIAVRANGSGAESEEADERLVLISAVEAANERSVWLKEGVKLDQQPRFDRKQFPMPPPNWRPPFPYQPGMVRWSVAI